MAVKGLIWLLVGAAIGLMAAPRSGASTRKEVLARINQAFGS
jgi:gas vesicle protein